MWLELSIKEPQQAGLFFATRPAALSATTFVSHVQRASVRRDRGLDDSTSLSRVIPLSQRDAKLTFPVTTVLYFRRRHWRRSNGGEKSEEISSLKESHRLSKTVTTYRPEVTIRDLLLPFQTLTETHSLYGNGNALRDQSSNPSECRRIADSESPNNLSCAIVC